MPALDASNSDAEDNEGFDQENVEEDAALLTQLVPDLYSEGPSAKRLKLDPQHRVELEQYKKQEIDLDTLRKRLAGPSVAKPGQEGVDQDKINQIIYDASLGSKFFNNEKKKDEQLTQKIEATLARARQITQGDLSADERRVDIQIAQIESTIDLSQYIMHIDCDAFYASVEELDKPELKNVPMGVGIGVLTTANYAARKYGVRSAMPSYIAKQLCPRLICVPLNFPRYIEKAEEIRAILSKADPNYQAASLDEAYLNITGYANALNMSPDDAVQELRAEIFQKTGLTVSAGIAANSRLAKIGSNMNKPNGQFRLANDRRTIMEFMGELPVRKVNGIGKVFERQLNALGIERCRDIYTHRGLLSRLFGEKSFDYLLNVYLGTGSTHIRPSADRERKSIGTESTFRSISDSGRLREQLRHTAEELEKDCIRADWRGRTLHLKIKKHTYEVYTRQCSLPKAIYRADDLYAYSLPLLEKEFPLDLRLMGLRLTHLCRISKPDLNGFFGVGQVQDRDSAILADRDATFQAEDEELLEGDKDFVSEPWSTSSDSIRKQAKLHASISSASDKLQAVSVCPICNRRIASDVNEHIDACLNQSAIREALAQDILMSMPDKVAPSLTAMKSSKQAQPTNSLSKWLKK
ncbi:hypothetical protein BCR37DRAFT_376616 [Protomyces lactucae-debilis]|uniref:DNA polymerase kappa n=1 Tax=Protomyces lactucae-debilis TaxID=2754530 RepID=A0A1Y2FQ36_PROLT|nr:uncharacterized protein BCR37DRAFT_376616 [Protomyces lactucae-debilis]ORY86088.1 hypothetical protein BCR37DRAFT_376616 [Protomyces lactucae-debilis]